ncbi:MAG: hypothetical protein MZV65_37185 [Chromatiales bacterium]|nr:hypothetical protein [Chromatiales bacterium]
MKKMRLLIFGFGALALSACATTERMYEGPERSRGEVAFFTGMNPADPLLAAEGWASQIKSVDGRPVAGSGTKVEILPGQHELVVFCKRPGAKPTNGKYTVTVEAGAEYVIGVKPGTNKCQFTDKKTGKEL